MNLKIVEVQKEITYIPQGNILQISAEGFWAYNYAGLNCGPLLGKKQEIYKRGIILL